MGKWDIWVSGTIITTFLFSTDTQFADTMTNVSVILQHKMCWHLASTF